MCGIVAFWSPEGGLSVEDLAPIGLLRHRGPDATATWVSRSGVAGLAQTRLAVVGVHNGVQPVRNETADVHAVVNGELYDYRRLRRELAGRGHLLRTESDSEIVPHLYEEDPDRFVTALRGEFAFVLWDETRRCLVAVRDRFGVKPLYYTWIGGRLALASEAKALFAAGAPRRWDAESFFDYVHACFPPDRTLFEGVFQVPPGAALRAGDAGVRIEPYWDLDFPLAEQVDRPADDPAETAARIRALVGEAVRLRLVADVPIGSHLSGGVDSSAVVGVAARYVPLRTFTVCFPGSPLDECGVAGRTALMLATEHHEVVVAGQPGPADIETVAAGEMLQENGHGTARLAQSTAIRDAGLRVALAGEGGDEVFLGYPHLRADLELGGSAPARASYRALSSGNVPATLSGTLDRLGFLPGWLVDRCLTTTMQARPLLHENLRARFADRDSLGALIDRSDEQIRGRAPVHQSLYLFLKTWFCNYILAAERLDMARSVEVRLPLLDHLLFEVVRELPLEELRRGRVKQVLRDAMRDYLTDEVFLGEKRPFFAPPPRDPVAAVAVLRGWIAAGMLDGNEFFDIAAVRSYLYRIEQRSRPLSVGQDRMLHLIASVCALHHTYRLG